MTDTDNTPKIVDVLDSLNDKPARCRHGYRVDRCHQGCDLSGGAEYDDVHRPSHYNNHPSGIECIEITRHCMSDMGQAIQYIWRWGLKTGEGARDLGKARFFLSDILANGLAHHPPHSAKVKLLLAVHADTTVRGVLLDHIAFGRLREAISLIDTLTTAAAHPETTEQDDH